jgi:hypothetical protein
MVLLRRAVKAGSVHPETVIDTGFPSFRSAGAAGPFACTGPSVPSALPGGNWI